MTCFRDIRQLVIMEATRRERGNKPIGGLHGCCHTWRCADGRVREAKGERSNSIFKKLCVVYKLTQVLCLLVLVSLCRPSS